MPRPVLDFEQYELRGILPKVFTPQQKRKLNQAVARAQGQLDWNAQLLGHNGPSYWGEQTLKSDGTYEWQGLPETMNEKRQLQVGTFGVYNKDRDYSEWPSPFNRSQIKASGDSAFHIWEQDGRTMLAPYGQGEEINYDHDPTIFAGGSYIFDAQVEFYNPHSLSDLVKTERFSYDDIFWTRAFILTDAHDAVGVRIKGSEAEWFFVTVKDWVDISDWKTEEARDQFIGLWGNKGNQFSMDFAFDALDLHGFDERYGLSIVDTSDRSLSFSTLLGNIGLKPTEWTGLYRHEFIFRVDGECEILAQPENELRSNRQIIGARETCNHTIKVFQVQNENGIAIDYFDFEFSSQTKCPLDRPKIEWIWEDPVLDNGDFDLPYTPPDRYPTVGEQGWGPWATYDDGEFDRPPIIGVEGASQEGTTRFYDGWEAFDDGEFNDPQWSECLPTLPRHVCENVIADNESIILSGNSQSLIHNYPDYDPCDCETECCFIDNDIYVYRYLYNGPKAADNCVYFISTKKKFEWTWDVDFLMGDWCGGPSDDIQTTFWADKTDGGSYTSRANFPDYTGQTIDCRVEASVIDNERTDYGVYTGPEIAAGREMTISCPIIDAGILGFKPKYEFEWNEQVSDLCGFEVYDTYYACDISDTDYSYVVNYSGYLDGCTMYIPGAEDGVLHPWDKWPPLYWDNGVLGSDTWDENAEDPDMYPYWASLDNEYHVADYSEGKFVNGCHLAIDYSFTDGGVLGPVAHWENRSYGSCAKVNNYKCSVDNNPNDDGVYEPALDAMAPKNDYIAVQNCKEYDWSQPPEDWLDDPNQDPVIEDCESVYPGCNDVYEEEKRCPVDPVYVSVSFADTFVFRMEPALSNCYSPLRTWKNQVLTVPEEREQRGDLDYRNFLVADENTGPNPEDNYRSYIRLPLEYQRQGREWNRAIMISNNQQYLQNPQRLSHPEYIENATPDVPLYDEAYDNNFDDYQVFYHEDFLVSTIASDTEDLQDGFKDAVITNEQDDLSPLQLFSFSEYDPYANREIDNENGDWRGSYLARDIDGKFTGYLSEDLANYQVRVIEQVIEPVYDESDVKHLNIDFPEDIDGAELKNYVISYAYFAADFAAADDPAFDPDKDYCWRHDRFECFGTNEETGDCEPETLVSPNTSYLLHPVS